MNTKQNLIWLKTKKMISVSFSNFICVIMSFTCVVPVIWMIYSSLKTEKEFSLSILSLPQTPQWGNYIKAFSVGNMGQYVVNSMFNSVVATVITCVLAFMVGYCLARFYFCGNRAIYYLFMAGMLVPIYALLLPIFIEFKTLHMINKAYTLLLPYIAFQLPIAVFLMESYMDGIPIELEEAAYIDGCGPIKAMFKIIMPVCKPVTATAAILTFLNNWNEFPLALVLVSKDALKTIPIGLTFFKGAHSTDFTLLFAALTIATLPVIVLYLLFSKQIMQGMVNGAVKG